MRFAKQLHIIITTVLPLLYSCSDSSSNATSIATESAAARVTLVNLNLLHGFDCDPPAPADGDQCRIQERIVLLRQHLIAEGCPDIVTLQEVVNKQFVQNTPTELRGPLDSAITLLENELPNLATACGFTYQIVYSPILASFVAETDEELILSRYPVDHIETYVMHSALYDVPNNYLLFARHVLYARIAHPTGEIDVYTTHLSSGADAASNSCNSFYPLLPGVNIGPNVPCPMACNSADTVRACQAEQLARFVQSTREIDNLALISGDFNATPGSSEYLSMTRRGWLDSHLAAGQPECDAADGAGCTSGRASRAASLQNPARQVNKRIDYIFVALPEADNSCFMSPETTVTGTYELVSAGLFAAESNPFAENCGAPPQSICWASNHSGNVARLACNP